MSQNARRFAEYSEKEPNTTRRKRISTSSRAGQIPFRGRENLTREKLEQWVEENQYNLDGLLPK